LEEGRNGDWRREELGLTKEDAPFPFVDEASPVAGVEVHELRIVRGPSEEWNGGRVMIGDDMESATKATVKLKGEGRGRFDEQVERKHTKGEACTYDQVRGERSLDQAVFESLVVDARRRAFKDKEDWQVRLSASRKTLRGER
jgi:hypothetical protein